MNNTTSTPDESCRWLNALPDEARVSDPGWRLIGRHARIMDAPAGTELFRAGDPCSHFVIVLSGCVRVQYLDHNGNEIVLYRVREGETCILTTSCLLGQARYPAQGVAEETLQAALVPMPVFQEALAHEPVRAYVFNTLGRRLVDLMLLIEEVAFRRMDGRLAQYLLKQGEVVRATHQEIAVELGSAREVVSRLLKDFERKGWIAMQRRRIEILERRALEELGCD